jgi:GNAT superfamily N-acetyltransferase
MPLVRHVLRASPPTAAAASPPTGIGIIPYDPRLDEGCVAHLTTPITGHDQPAEPRPSAAALIRELQSRPARQVHAWLARTAATESPAGACLGLVALVESAGGTSRRFSISWLIVADAARRRGIGTALVDHAMRLAGSLGATHVFVDTQADWPAARAFWDAMAGR